MKVILQKVVAMLAVGVVVFGISSKQVSAEYIDARNGNLGFAASWERYTSGDNDRATLTYGFNTFLVNEDYALANHAVTSHYAYISNSKGGFAGPTKQAGTVSKCEVTHNGTSIHYMNHYSY